MFFTIGYGGRSPTELLERLGAHGVRTIVDVRLRPDRAHLGSFARSAEPGRGIEGWLEPAGILYRARIDLGNLFREREDWRAPYARLLAVAGDLLLEGLDELPGPICLLCAEKRPADCHRSLIADALVGRGHEVLHIE